jgi:type IV secretion system protein TrbD
VRELRRVPIHRALNRPNLFMGGDRELMLFALMLAAILIFSVFTWWSILLGIVMWVLAAAALRRMGKSDPYLRHVYTRHTKYVGYYPARPHVTGLPRDVPQQWK